MEDLKHSAKRPFLSASKSQKIRDSLGGTKWPYPAKLQAQKVENPKNIFEYESKNFLSATW